MKIEVGKRYVRRNGILSGVIYSNASGLTGLEFPFRDETETYNPSGQCWYTNQSELDLIAEYKEQEMKEIDFEKPLRFSTPDKATVHYIGLDKDGKHVCQKTRGMEAIFTVDQFGNSEKFVQIENTPEKITQWCNFYPSGSGGTHATRTEADRSATSERIACVPVTFELGEGL